VFSVAWHDRALDQLANAWVQADSPTRAAIQQSVATLDNRLERDPENEGESRPSGLRVSFEAPVGILFHVDMVNRIVSVMHFWTY
jgi:hypothetical protein